MGEGGMEREVMVFWCAFLGEGGRGQDWWRRRACCLLALEGEAAASAAATTESLSRGKAPAHRAANNNDFFIRDFLVRSRYPPNESCFSRYPWICQFPGSCASRPESGPRPSRL